MAPDYGLRESTAYEIGDVTITSSLDDSLDGAREVEERLTEADEQ